MLLHGRRTRQGKILVRTPSLNTCISHTGQQLLTLGVTCEKVALQKVVQSKITFGALEYYNRQLHFFCVLVHQLKQNF